MAFETAEPAAISGVWKDFQRSRRFRSRLHEESDSGLARSQRASAQKRGYSSWLELARAAEGRSGRTAAERLRIAAERAVEMGELEVLEELLSRHSELLQGSPTSVGLNRRPAPSFDAKDARATVFRSHCFATWKDYEAFRSRLADATSKVSQFELAADAVAWGDLATLERLLAEGPQLVFARSERTHGGTLLHYVGANGIECFRQQATLTAPAIARALLRAGAEVDGRADMYGGATPLALIATSRHPRLAGTQKALLELLIERGAKLDLAAASNGRSIVQSCLANGCCEAAELLAGHGAWVNLESASGLGWLSAVTTRFKALKDQGRKPYPAEAAGALANAARYGRTSVVEHLLDQEIPVDAELDGFTGAHLAAVNGQAETLGALIRRGASLEQRNAYGGTVLASALWGIASYGESEGYLKTLAVLLGAGAVVDDEVIRWWKSETRWQLSAQRRVLKFIRSRLGASQPEQKDSQG